MQTLIYITVSIVLLLLAVAIFKRMSSGGGTSDRLPAAAAAADPAAARSDSSLRPVVDIGLCMGSGGCVTACPYRALGLVRGKAVLANPDNCLGHGVCAAACPVGAISFIPAPQSSAA